jgi:hypothetical protein
MALYEDRVFAFKRMQEIERQLDDHPELAEEMVLNHERNLRAQYELEHYQEHQQFIYNHPILKGYQQETRLEKLRRLDPEGFIDELAKAKDYIKRYKYYLNKPNLTKEQETNYKQHLSDYREKLKIMQELLSK